MECQRRIALETAIAALTQAAKELRNALQQPDDYPLAAVGDLLLGVETDRAIREMYHDLQLTQIKTSQELQDHLLNCDICEGR